MPTQESSRTPLIGVTGRRYLARAFNPPEMERVMDGVSLDGFYTGYSARLAEAGAAPVFITREAAPARLVEYLDGFVLGGGLDVDPRLYGERPTAHSTSLDPAQDEFEIALAKAAIEADRPVLGTCRGHELLNVAFGGTLVPHLEGTSGPFHRRISYPLADRGHEVGTATGSTVHSLYGERVTVNSFHHQAVDQVADGFRVTAVADDGVVEAIEHEQGHAIGVQWHPEFSAALEPVLGWLVERAGANREAATARGRSEAPEPTPGMTP
ncbi:MAG TPA: gamma-glutamyl-gamma-aminobutyrate hydrolase family protein [Solirubrobacterales bacterium]|nr:gamma-glutamyl-gamma-aminobutyrate hydrolase family protein [Solirubrobacterales bacterium]